MQPTHITEPEWVNHTHTDGLSDVGLPEWANHTEPEWANHTYTEGNTSPPPDTNVSGTFRIILRPHTLIWILILSTAWKK